MINSCSKNLLVADEFSLWWTPQRLTSIGAKVSTVLLSENFYQQIVEATVPLDLRAVKALKKSPLTLDLYAWATRRVSYLSRPTLIPWQALRLSFGRGMPIHLKGALDSERKSLTPCVELRRSIPS